MDPRDPPPSPTVFDLPPGETGEPAHETEGQARFLREAHAAGGNAMDDEDSGSSRKRTGNSSTREPKRVSETPPAILQRRLDKGAQLGVGPERKPATTARPSNLRRTEQVRGVFALALLANALVVLIAGYFYHQHLMGEIEQRLRATGGARGASEGGPAMPERAMDQLHALEEQVQRQAVQLEQLAASVPAPGGEGGAKTGSRGGAPTQSLALVQSDVAYLKSRNRLTAAADEAIATGERAPYERLWSALDGPESTELAAGARAEILRVHNFYVGGTRLERYEIPVGTYFPEEAMLRDSQLKDGQLIKLLLEKKNPWQVRMKAANLLGARRSEEVGDALVKAAKDDANLDVVKEAMFSFEQMAGYRGRIFDAASMEQWWVGYKSTPTPTKLKARVSQPAAVKAGTGKDRSDPASTLTDSKAKAK